MNKKFASKGICFPKKKNSLSLFNQDVKKPNNKPILKFGNVLFPFRNISLNLNDQDIAILETREQKRLDKINFPNKSSNNDYNQELEVLISNSKLNKINFPVKSHSFKMDEEQLNSQNPSIETYLKLLNFLKENEIFQDFSRIFDYKQNFNSIFMNFNKNVNFTPRKINFPNKNNAVFPQVKSQHNAFLDINNNVGSQGQNLNLFEQKSVTGNIRFPSKNSNQVQLLVSKPLGIQDLENINKKRKDRKIYWIIGAVFLGAFLLTSSISIPLTTIKSSSSIGTSGIVIDVEANIEKLESDLKTILPRAINDVDQLNQELNNEITNAENVDLILSSFSISEKDKLISNREITSEIKEVKLYAQETNNEDIYSITLELIANDGYDFSQSKFSFELNIAKILEPGLINVSVKDNALIVAAFKSFLPQQVANGNELEKIINDALLIDNNKIEILETINNSSVIESLTVKVAGEINNYNLELHLIPNSNYTLNTTTLNVNNLDIDFLTGSLVDVEITNNDLAIEAIKQFVPSYIDNATTLKSELDKAMLNASNKQLMLQQIRNGIFAIADFEIDVIGQLGNYDIVLNLIPKNGFKLSSNQLVINDVEISKAINIEWNNINQAKDFLIQKLPTATTSAASLDQKLQVMLVSNQDNFKELLTNSAAIKKINGQIIGEHQNYNLVLNFELNQGYGIENNQLSLNLDYMKTLIDLEIDYQAVINLFEDNLPSRADNAEEINEAIDSLIATNVNFRNQVLNHVKEKDFLLDRFNAYVVGSQGSYLLHINFVPLFEFEIDKNIAIGRLNILPAIQIDLAWTNNNNVQAQLNTLFSNAPRLTSLEAYEDYIASGQALDFRQHVNNSALLKSYEVNIKQTTPGTNKLAPVYEIEFIFKGVIGYKVVDQPLTLSSNQLVLKYELHVEDDVGFVWEIRNLMKSDKELDQWERWLASNMQKIKESTFKYFKPGNVSSSPTKLHEAFTNVQFYSCTYGSNYYLSYGNFVAAPGYYIDPNYSYSTQLIRFSDIS